MFSNLLHTGQACEMTIIITIKSEMLDEVKFKCVQWLTAITGMFFRQKYTTLSLVHSYINNFYVNNVIKIKKANNYVWDWQHGVHKCLL